MSASDPRMAADETLGDPYGLHEIDGAEPRVRSCSLEQRNEVQKVDTQQVKGSGGGEQQEGRPRTESSRSRTDSKSSKMAGGYEVVTLPQTFLVKYLGETDASGLWGIKFTRKPVDLLVGLAKNAKQDSPLLLVKLEVSLKGIKMTGHNTNPKDKSSTFTPQEFTIDSISYGVQDLVYTRVFAMIVVSETSNAFQNHPFKCYAFVCDCRTNARRLTLALAKAFQEFSHSLKGNSDGSQDMTKLRPKRFAIDLRDANELKRDMAVGAEEDSEA